MRRALKRTTLSLLFSDRFSSPAQPQHDGRRRTPTVQTPPPRSSWVFCSDWLGMSAPSFLLAYHVIQSKEDLREAIGQIELIDDETQSKKMLRERQMERDYNHYFGLYVKNRREKKKKSPQAQRKPVNST